LAATFDSFVPDISFGSLFESSMLTPASSETFTVELVDLSLSFASDEASSLFPDPNKGFTIVEGTPDVTLDIPVLNPPPNAPKGDALSNDVPNVEGDEPADNAPKPVLFGAGLNPDPNKGAEVLEDGIVPKLLLPVDEVLPNENGFDDGPDDDLDGPEKEKENAPSPDEDPF
jgi:hypothetical protein